MKLKKWKKCEIIKMGLQIGDIIEHKNFFSDTIDNRMEVINITGEHLVVKYTDNDNEMIIDNGWRLLDGNEWIERGDWIISEKNNSCLTYENGKVLPGFNFIGSK